MGRYLNYYEIDVYYNGREFDVPPESLSFSTADSIYSLYNYGGISIDDPTSYYQEFFVTMEGAIVTLKFGNTSGFNSCDFMIKKDQVDVFYQPGFFSGEVDVEIVNSWYNKQEAKTIGFKAPISTILTDILSNSGFTSLDIEITGNNDYWYQMGYTDAKFIRDILLPNAYSSSSKTPFFAYITNDNVFHLKSLATMLSSSPVATIEYAVPPSNSDNFNYTLNVRRWHQNSDDHREFLSRKIYKVSQDDGSLLETTDDIGSYPPKNNLTVPIMNWNKKTSSIVNLDFEHQETGPSENLLGQQVNSTKKSMFLDRFFVFMPLNPAFKSGATVQFNAYTLDQSNQPILSKRFSGIYVIENCEQIWNKEDRKGYSKLIIGRKYIGVIPSSYLMKPQLI